MSKKENPGKVFEAEVIASLPTTTLGGRKVYRHKLADMPFAPTRPGRFQPRAGIQFQPKHPYDLAISCQCAGTEKMKARAVPQVVMKLEIKRSAGSISQRGANRGHLHATLGFGRVARHQVAGLRKAAAAGQVAGILWLVELDGAGACTFLPIQDWCDYIAEQTGEPFPESFSDKVWAAYLEKAKSKSMPLATARARGIEVAEDVGRGRERRYWKMPELMIRFGASVEPTPKRKAAMKRLHEPIRPWGSEQKGLDF